MARRRTITKRRRGLFLEKLKQSGSVTKAAIAGEIGRSSWYDLRHKDPDFVQAWDDAEMFFLDNCEAEAIRRAIFGVDEEVPYTYYLANGEKETRYRTINRKSDRLLELCLKSRHPNYAPKQALELTAPDGGLTGGTAPPDYSALDNEELRLLVELQRKLHAAAEHPAT